MLREMVEIIQEGDKSGNGRLFRLTLPSGLEILGLPTENHYGGGWDLGPTWNYVVCGDKPFLVDTGRARMGRKLLDMMQFVGIPGEHLDFVMLSHGHEDHDGGLAEITRSTGVKVKAHFTYDRLIRLYPNEAPSEVRKDFPASCWRCFMPESFSTKNCREYHKARSKLKVKVIPDGHFKLAEAMQVYHVPGHSPDSLAILVAGEAIIVGDTVLPDITPLPSQEGFFSRVSEILKPQVISAQAIYGLRAYIKSIKKLRKIGKTFPDLIVLPGHRLFYNNEWREISLEARTNELIEHHMDRCGDILRILKQGPMTAREIAEVHYAEHLLKGFGRLMAENEILSHCELLSASNDVVLTEDTQFVSTGSTNFESAIESLEPD